MEAVTVLGAGTDLHHAGFFRLAIGKKKSTRQQLGKGHTAKEFTWSV